MSRRLTQNEKQQTSAGSFLYLYDESKQQPWFKSTYRLGLVVVESNVVLIRGYSAPRLPFLNVGPTG